MVLYSNDALLATWLKNQSICNFSMPFCWNQDMGMFQVKPNKNTTKKHKARLAIAFVYLTLALVQALLTWKHSTRNVTMHSITFITAFIMSLTSHSVNWIYRNEVVNLFNALLDFDRNQLSREQIQAQKFPTKTSVAQLFTKFLISVQTATGLFMPILYHLNVLRDPCFPMYVGYWLCEQCQNTELGMPQTVSVQIGTKLMISLVSYTQWSFVYGGHCFHIGIELMLQGTCLQAFVEHIGR